MAARADFRVNLRLVAPVEVGVFGKFVWLGLVASALVLACTSVEVTSPGSNLPLGDGGFGEPAGGDGSMGGAAGGGEGGEPSIGGGRQSSLELGLWPTFAADPSRSADVQAVFAATSVLSAGVRTLPLAERWDVLSGATGSPRAAAFNRLDAMVAPYREQRGHVTMCINLVERQAAAWPVTGQLDSAEATAALDRTIDEVLSRYSPLLSRLCFGYEIDRYLATVSSSAQKRLLALLTHGVDYAHKQAPQTPVGVAISLQALAKLSSAPLDELLLGDEAMVVFDPLQDGTDLKPTDAFGAEVGAALATLSERSAPPLPLSILEVGYPSSEAAGSSETAQAEFFDKALQTLESSADALAFVGIFGLGDRSSSDCTVEASEFGGGAAAENERALVRCSMGLLAGSGTEKAAWPEVLAGIARYRMGI